LQKGRWIVADDLGRRFCVRSVQWTCEHYKDSLTETIYEQRDGEERESQNLEKS